ncbi:MAG: DNA methyltransferase [Alphaproteobacteria bacterium]|nr:DNA methyltransferase [Alphaproteobacteria bacterium]
MRGMDSATVDLIYLDPPFKKGKDFHATPDSLAKGAKFQDRWSWERDTQPDWLERIQDDWPAVWEVIDAANAIYMRRTKKNLARPREEVGSDMGAFLCFMAVRLMEMERVLKPTGSIYLHCDYSASHYLKATMDGIFGKKNFRNEIIWCYAGGGIPEEDFPRKHDTILRYSKSDDYTYNPIYREYSPGTVQRGRTKVKGKYFEEGLREEGTPVNDWWPDAPKITSPTDPEKYGFPTQKPLVLLDRIIRASSNEGDMVMDPFCGCATTPIAAERAERQWAGIDIWETAHQAVIDRLVQEKLMPPDGDRRGGDLFPVGQVHYETEPPKRRDGGDEAAPFLPTPERRNLPKEPWQRMGRKAMFAALAEAQTITRGLCLCAGCGRELEPPFMELDHITPRSDRGANDISNRILLCRPCNGRKNANLTMRGLIRENKKVGWMQDERRAVHARELAQACYEEIRYGAAAD